MKLLSGRVLRGQRRVTFPAAALVLLCQLAAAATYYVNPNGNDDNAGTIAAPFRTVQHAADEVNPGDTVIVQAGTYGPEGARTGGDASDSSNTPVRFNRSGNSSAQIVFRSENKWGAVLDCQMVCDAYFNLGSASYITIQDFEIKNGFKEAIHSNDSAHHINLIGNHIHHIANRSTSTQYGQDGIYTNPNCHDFVIDGNLFHDIGRTNATNLDHALYLKGYNYTITNNVFHNMVHGWCIQAAAGLTNVLIANNTFAFGNQNQGGQIMLWDSQSSITIDNNIFYQPGNYAIARYQSSLSGCVADNNIVYGASSLMSDNSGCSVGANYMGANPGFVNAASAPYDFHVSPGGAGIDMGVPIDQVTHDMEGRARPQGNGLDIGAYEYGGAPAAPAATTAPAAPDTATTGDTAPSAPAPAATQAPVISGLNVTLTTPQSATITWNTDKPADSRVLYGPGILVYTTSDATLVTSHSVTVKLIIDAKWYQFKVMSRDSSDNITASETLDLAPAAL